MALISLKDLSYAYAGPMLLKNINFQIEAGEKIGLLGRNGAGKSTVMKLINREITPNSGEIVYQQGVTAARLIQEVPEDQPGTCLHCVLAGFTTLGQTIERYNGLLERMSAGDETVNMQQLELLQHEIDVNNGWDIQTRAESILSMVSVDPTTPFNSLSGGMKRRVLLAKTLVTEPDVLLLDEPTNHLDIHSIRWMENFLIAYRGTVIFVTHDRAFLQDLATRIVEIDRGSVVSWNCNYHKFLQRREDAYESELKTNAVFDKKLSREETWIRTGIKARRTRNQGRVRALKQLRSERSARVVKKGNVKMNITGAQKSGHLVSVVKNISFSYGDHTIIDPFSYTLVRGDRIGFIGANGSGKTTLVKLLLGELAPATGTIEIGTKLEVAYFDQLRENLDDHKTVLENLGMGERTFMLNGYSKSVMGYLQDFLFDPDQARSPVGHLSGGEKNRLQLARMFTKPSNVLVLDEPTNDLDIETLELLEDLLMEYKGTVIIVSHDREFINNLTSSTLVLEGDGNIKEYVDGYDTWLKEWDIKQKEIAKKRTQPTHAKAATAVTSIKPVKLTYKEKELLKTLPQEIERLETEQQKLQQKIADESFYKKDPDEIAKTMSRNETITIELDKVFTAWAALDEKAGTSN